MSPTTFLLRVLATCGILAGALSLPADEPRNADPRDAEIAALKAKVHEQAQEIGRLRAELDAARRARPFETPPYPPAPPNVQPPLRIVPEPQLSPDAQPGGRVPREWIPREFNGNTYYLIPVSQSVRSPATARHADVTVMPRE